MSASRRRFMTVGLVLGAAVVIVVAELSYGLTRASIKPGPAFAVPGVARSGNAYVVPWRLGTDVAIIASFVPSKPVRVRSVTLPDLDPKIAYIASAEYGLLKGDTPLPIFRAETDPLPAELHPLSLRGAFRAAGGDRIVLRLVIRGIANATTTVVLHGISVDVESWSWAHTTLVRFPQSVKLEPPR
jgi:hypothetical protein